MGIELTKWLVGVAQIKAEVAAAGNVVTAIVLRPGDPHWAWGFVTTAWRGAACLYCGTKPCDPIAGVVVIQADEGSMGIPIPYCDACAAFKTIKAGWRRVLADLFPKDCVLRIQVIVKKEK